jgi:hypothetical protein
LIKDISFKVIDSGINDFQLFSKISTSQETEIIFDSKKIYWFGVETLGFLKNCDYDYLINHVYKKSFFFFPEKNISFKEFNDSNHNEMFTLSCCDIFEEFFGYSGLSKEDVFEALKYQNGNEFVHSIFLFREEDINIFNESYITYLKIC